MPDHTPGPWSVIPTPYDPDHTHKIMYDCVHEGWRRIGAVGGVFAKDSDEAEANARLMAAAPELLDACKELLIYLGDWDDMDNETCQAARHAISLAEGTDGKDRRVD
jgi:hypothetical protein